MGALEILFIIIIIYTIVTKCKIVQWTTMEKKRKERKKKLKKIKNKNNFILGKRLGTILELAPIGIFCLVTESKGQVFRGIAGFYSILGAVDYTAVIFSAHLVAVKCDIFTTRENSYAFDQQPSWRIPLLPAYRVRQSSAHARTFKWKGFNKQKGKKEEKKKT